MITPAYAQAMAAYNTRLNRVVYDAAACLTDEGRNADRGAFWRSIHGTLNHLLWADRMWMHRFDGWDKPELPLRDSHTLYSDFEILEEARTEADTEIAAWAQRLDAGWLAGDGTWFSGAVQQEVTRPRALLVVHMFNHQTHHRGQAHAMLGAAGQGTGATDLWLAG